MNYSLTKEAGRNLRGMKRTVVLNKQTNKKMTEISNGISKPNLEETERNIK